MTDEQKEACHVIIHGAATAAGATGAGLAQLPLTDSAVIIPLQVAMIIALGKVFEIQLTEGAAKGMALAATAALVGRAASQILVGWIPFLGNAINAATAAGITEALGWTIAKEFDKKKG